MIIKTYLNTTREEVESKKFNIFIGISLGNKLFTKEAIKEYIVWALQNSKEKIIVLIADKIHAINYEIRNHYSKERAYSAAMRRGKEIENQLISIRNSFLPSERGKIEILHWEEIEKSEKYLQRKEILLSAFEKNKNFHKLIIEIVKENVSSKPPTLKDLDFEKLARYVLLELPIFINGFAHLNIQYNLIPYPGIGKIDALAVDLQEGKAFPEITKKLGVAGKVAILEVYTKSMKKPNS